MELFLIRHTKVDVEPGICYGQTDVGLAESFVNEANSLKMLIKGFRFDRIYSSPLSRCKELAVELFPAKEIIYDNRLKELDFGDWEMKSWDAVFHSEKGKTWMENYQTAKCLNGESYPEMVQRVDEFLSEIKREGEKKIAIVAHAGVIRIIKSIVENIPVSELFDSFKPEYGSLTKLDL